MRLHLLIDSHIKPNSSEDDLVLLSLMNTYREFSGRKILLNINIANEDYSITDATRLLFEKLPLSFRMIINPAYVRFIHPIYTYIRNIEKIINDHNVTQLVLYGGSTSPFFISTGGEGEGRQDNYETNWLVNAFINSYFKDKIDIKWIRRTRPYRSAIYNYWRSSKNLMSLLLKNIVNCIKCGSTKTINLTENTIISFVTLIGQYNHIRSIVNSYPKHKHEVFTVNRHLVQNSEVHMMPFLTFSQLLHIVIDIYYKKKIIDYSFMGVDCHSLMRELRYMLLRYCIYERRVENCLNCCSAPTSCIILTNTTFGDDMVAVYSVARRKGIKHKNVQYVSMNRLAYPNLDLADEYYLYSKTTWEYYSRYDERYKLFFPRIKNISFANKSATIIFSVFLQPDYIEKDFFDYLSELLPLIRDNKINVDVIIKPHYRQNNPELFEKLIASYDNVMIAAPDETSTDVLKKSTLSMSICSSVIFESMSMGVPCIVFNPNHKYDTEVYHEDMCFPEVNFITEKASQTIDYLSNTSASRHLFNQRLNNYIEKESIATDLAL